MTRAHAEKRVAEIEARHAALSPRISGGTALEHLFDTDVPWLIAELRAAWAREDEARAFLKQAQRGLAAARAAVEKLQEDRERAVNEARARLDKSSPFQTLYEDTLRLCEDRVTSGRHTIAVIDALLAGAKEGGQ